MLAEVVAQPHRFAGVVDELRVQRKLLVQALGHANFLQHLRQLVAAVGAGLLVAVAGHLRERGRRGQRAAQCGAQCAPCHHPPNCPLLHPHWPLTTDLLLRNHLRVHCPAVVHLLFARLDGHQLVAGAGKAIGQRRVDLRRAAWATLSGVAVAALSTGRPRWAINSIARSMGMRMVPGWPSTRL